MVWGLCTTPAQSLGAYNNNLLFFTNMWVRILGRAQLSGSSAPCSINWSHLFSLIQLPVLKDPRALPSYISFRSFLKYSLGQGTFFPKTLRPEKLL